MALVVADCRALSEVPTAHSCGLKRREIDYDKLYKEATCDRFVTNTCHAITRLSDFTTVPGAPTVLGTRGGGVEWLLRRR
jgi:hypothetical protein